MDCFLVSGGRYMVVDCGGGTVDITVHEIINNEGHLKELFKATGGPYGSVSEFSRCTNSKLATVQLYILTSRCGSSLYETS